jgi:hypothetical protein
MTNNDTIHSVNKVRSESDEERCDEDRQVNIIVLILDGDNTVGWCKLL